MAIVGMTFVVAITACAGPADQELVTGSTDTAYRTSLESLVPEMDPLEVKAFDWAVSDFDLAMLHAKYPAGTPREVIRGEVSHVLQTYPQRIEELQARQLELAPIREDLSKISASSTGFSIEKNVFGLQPMITATVFNGSTLPVSSLDWKASIFVNDATEPAATKVLSNNYRNDGGLNPGQTFVVTFKVGFVRGDDNWSTLEIRNADKTRVELEPILPSVQDFGERTTWRTIRPSGSKS